MEKYFFIKWTKYSITRIKFIGNNCLWFIKYFIILHNLTDRILTHSSIPVFYKVFESVKIFTDFKW